MTTDPTTPERREAGGVPETHKCGTISIDYETGVVTKHGITNVGGCRDGCCDDYRCDGCGKTFRVEWPD